MKLTKHVKKYSKYFVMVIKSTKEKENSNLGWLYANLGGSGVCLDQCRCGPEPGSREGLTIKLSF